MVKVRVPYGRSPREVDLGESLVEVLEAPSPPPPLAPAQLAARITDALAAPIGSAPLEVLARGIRHVTVVVSDHTRNEPRSAFLLALRERLPSGISWTLAIATGTHGPSPLEPLGLEVVLSDRSLDLAVINHDGGSLNDLVHLGYTRRGTPIVVHRCVVETDLVIATGCIRPHYFAGYGAGAKAIFPGMGERAAIRTNHLLKAHPAARAGNVIDNPCREDLEEAARALPCPTFLLNGVVGADDSVCDVVAGDLVAAFRDGARRAATWSVVRAPPATIVVASDALPVTASLYQAAKIAASVAPLVAAGGRLVVVAECFEGIGPLEVVNDSIFRIGVLPRLRAGVSLELLSSLPPAAVRQTMLTPITDVCPERSQRVLVVPRASHLVLEAD